MTLFAVFALLDTDQSYKDRTREIVSRRGARLYNGLGITLAADRLRSG